MFKKLFGTDGVRSTWGEITPELAYKVGVAVAKIFERENENNTIIIGKDTRLSCDALESAMISGITSRGSNVIQIGVVPTAVVPFSIAFHKANAGVMITASHNSAEYNGFKFFNGNGFKIIDEQESHIENIVANVDKYPIREFNGLGRTKLDTQSVDAYINFVKTQVKICKKTRICFDCADGCAGDVVEKVFKGYNAEIFNSYPTGLNPNLKCGANNIHELQKIMENSDFEIGFSFDGDADRVRVALKGGKLLSGEEVMYHLVKYNQEKKLVTTKMSNSALYSTLQNDGVESIIVDIGEKPIVEGLLEHHALIAGENNGHYIILGKNTTSDGILACAEILSAFEINNGLTSDYVPYFQMEGTVASDKKHQIVSSELLQDKIEICESLLAEAGRILVRASGTEDVIRILVEGEDNILVQEVFEEIKKYINSIN